MPSTRSNEDVSRIACIVRTTAAARFARADPSPPPLREISCRVGCMDLWRAHRGSEERVKAAERLFDDPVDLAATRRFLENDGLVKRLSCGDRRGRTEGSTGAPPERRQGRARLRPRRGHSGTAYPVFTTSRKRCLLVFLNAGRVCAGRAAREGCRWEPGALTAAVGPRKGPPFLPGSRVRKRNRPHGDSPAGPHGLPCHGID